MIRVMLHDGESVTLNAAPKDMSTGNGTLTVRRDGSVIASFRRSLGWHEVSTTE